MSLTDLLNALIRAFVIALLICAFVQRGRFPVRFLISFSSAVIGCVVTALWSH